MIAYLIGDKGREHAMAEALGRSPLVSRIIAAPGNPGILGLPKVEPAGISVLDIEGHAKLARDIGADLVLCGPERPLAMGLADIMREKSLRVFGPSASQMKIESSKRWAKLLAWKHKIPTAPYRAFDHPRHAKRYLSLIREWPVVVKADGLADGKGVVIAETETEAETAIDDLMVRKIHGEAGAWIVIEKYIRGREFSPHAVVSGATYRLFPATEDHKRVGDGDTGPNGGGSGVIFRPLWVSPRLMQFAEEAIIAPTVEALAEMKNTHHYSGILYPGVMYDVADPQTPLKELEVGGRLGDPEAEVYLPMLESDFFEICLAAAVGDPLPPIRFKMEYAACVVLCSEKYGYVPNPPIGFPISGIKEAEKDPHVIVYHCGTSLKDGTLVTAGGRVLAVTAQDQTYGGAIHRAYRAVAKIGFQGMSYRRDIGRRKNPSIPPQWR